MSQTSLLGNSTCSLHEFEVARIQRESENVTHKLEVERRIGFALDDSIKELTKKLSEKQKQVESAINWKKLEHKDQHRLKLLENNLGVTKTKLSELRTQNNNLRDQIELMRRNKRSTLMHTHSLMTEIERTSSTAALHATTADRIMKLETRSRARMTSMQDLLEVERSTFTDKVSQLESILVADKKAQSDIIKNFSQNDMKLEVTDGVRLIRMLAEKWQAKAKETRKVLDKYKDTMKKRYNAVHSMSDQSGIEDMQELTKAVISSFDHTKDLEAYIIKTQENIQNIEQELDSCNSRMNLLKNSKRYSDSERSSVLSIKSKSLQDSKSSLERKLSKLNFFRTNLSSLKDSILSILNYLRSLGIQPSFTKFIDDEAELNERNFKPLITTLEESLSTFIVILKKMQNDSRAQLAMIDLDNISSKEIKETLLGTLSEPDIKEVEDEHHILTAQEMRRRAAAEISSLSSMKLNRLSI
jgi:hypothetical protein